MLKKLKDYLREKRTYWVIRRSGFFDRSYYLRNNLDVARSCMDPILHYVRHGWREGRNPSELFNTKWYLERYRDVRESGINPLYHYIGHGMKESRNTYPPPYTGKNIRPEHNAAEHVPIINESDCAPGLISVIIPVHNTKEHLPGLLDSLRQQTYNNTEVIVVDDGSDQNHDIRKIISTYRNRFSLSFHELKQNGGANYARNFGFSKSTGEFLFFCDSDVVLSHTFFEKMLHRLHEVPSASWVYCNYWLGSRPLRFGTFDNEQIYRKNYCSTMSLIRRECFPGFDENIRRYQDWDLFLTIYENGGRGEWIDEFLFFAEERPDGITNSNKISDREARIILKEKHEKVVIL